MRESPPTGFPAAGSSWPSRPSPATPPRTCSIRTGSTPPSRTPTGLSTASTSPRTAAGELDQGQPGDAPHPGERHDDRRHPDQRSDQGELRPHRQRPHQRGYQSINQNQIGNYALAMTIDPSNPNIVYLGGSQNFQETGPDPDRPDRPLRSPQLRELLQQPERRRHALRRTSTGGIGVMNPTTQFPNGAYLQPADPRARADARI